MANAERIYTHNGFSGTAKELCILRRKSSTVYACKGYAGTALQLCKIFNVKAYLFMRRVHKGMSAEEAIEELLKNKA